jgi:hypothetical protein
MKLLTQEQIDRLARNGRANAERIEEDGNTIDFEPVVKLFLPDGPGLGFRSRAPEPEMAGRLHLYLDCPGLAICCRRPGPVFP